MKLLWKSLISLLLLNFYISASCLAQNNTANDFGLGKFKTKSKTDSTLIINTENGNLEIKPYSKNVIRLIVSLGKSIE